MYDIQHFGNIMVFDFFCVNWRKIVMVLEMQVMQCHLYDVKFDYVTRIIEWMNLSRGLIIMAFSKLIVVLTDL